MSRLISPGELVENDPGADMSGLAQLQCCRRFW
jgi:hypothetical protein